MRIIAKVEMTNYAQWCSLVVASLFDSRNITFNGEEIDTVEIEAIDEQRIYLSILSSINLSMYRDSTSYSDFTFGITFSPFVCKIKKAAKTI